jgi:hypothetical protein
MMTLSVVTRQDCPDGFEKWAALPAFATSQQHPFFNRLGRAYYAATYDCDHDTSFAVVRDDEPLMLVWCNIHEGTLGYFGMPMSFFSRAGLEDADSVIAAALGAVDRIAVARGATDIALREDITGSELSSLGRGCVSRGATLEAVQNGICDLSLDEKTFHRNIRKSFQSLVNTGRRNMRMTYFNVRNLDSGLFESYREFHAHVAGQVTRSAESWRAMFNWIAGGGGELALGYLDDRELVAGTMTFDGTDVAYYASGAYDRSKFDKPLAHFPLYDAVLRSKERGMRYFDLGHLPARGTVGDKEYNIGYFKRGFASSIEVHFCWRWRPSKIGGGSQA